MTWAATGIGLGSLALGAGSSIYSASQAPKGTTQHSLPMSGYAPFADPLLSSLSMLSSTGVGGYSPTYYQQANPAAQILQAAQASGAVNRRQYRYLESALAANTEALEQASKITNKKARKKFLKAHGLSKQAIKGYDLANRMAITQGYSSYGDLKQKNKQYLDQLQAVSEQYQPVSNQLREGLLASQGRVGEYLQELPNLLGGEDNPFIKRLREEALITAQKYGVNPYNYLEEARSTALNRALQLIAGEQAVVGNQQQAALPIAQLRQQGGATAAQIGAQQAQTLASVLQGNTQYDLARAQQFGQLGNQLAGLGLIGSDMLRGPAAK